MDYTEILERWGVFEVSCKGTSVGNPFTERKITGTFESQNEKVTVDGFYDGDGVYKVRFMPSYEGTYRFSIKGNFTEEPAGEGSVWDGTFEVTAPAAGNHGPVRVANGFHFAYEDGTPYYSIGTTCYVWDLQSDERIGQTLESLKQSAFNKIRFCVFPKHYDYNLGEPRSYPYVGTPMDSGVLTKENFQEYTFKTEGNNFDYTRFNPEHFRHVEWCIRQLCELGIEADLIMMHPYDRWGFCTMTKSRTICTGIIP